MAEYPHLLALRQAANTLPSITDDAKRAIAQMADADHLTLIRYFDEFRRSAELFSQAKKAISELEEKLSRELVPEAMRRAGVKTTNVVGVGRVTINNKWSCTIIDKSRGIQWLKEHDYGDLVQETVNSSTLAAFSKRLSEDEGKDLPVDIFKTGTVPYTSITKG